MSIDDFKLAPEQVAALRAKARASEARSAAGHPRRKRAFVSLSLTEIAVAAQAMNCPRVFVWAWLKYRMWQTKSATVAVSNRALIGYGIDRYAKYHALAQLEAAGLVRVERRTRRTPVVTLIEVGD